MPFRDALKARLDLMTPSQETVQRCLREHPPRLSPGVCWWWFCCCSEHGLTRRLSLGRRFVSVVLVVR